MQFRRPDRRNKLSHSPHLFPRASHGNSAREDPLASGLPNAAGRSSPSLRTQRAAMARGIAASRVSSVLSGVGRGQWAGVAVRIAATIPARTSAGRLAHAATRRARSASGGAWPPPAFGRDVDGTGPPVGPPVRPRPAPRLAPGAVSAAPGAARPSESAYSPGDSASARGFDSPRLHTFSLGSRTLASSRGCPPSRPGGHPGGTATFGRAGCIPSMALGNLRPRR